MNKKRSFLQQIWQAYRLSLAGLAFLLLLALSLLHEADGRHVRFYYSGDSSLTTAYGKPYEEPGVRAVTIGRLTGAWEIPAPVRVHGRVDTGKPGSYTLRYSAGLFARGSVLRSVQVRDLTAPEITLRRREGYSPSWFEGYEEEGFTALDDLDGDLTAFVTCSDRDGVRLYSVTDRAGNTATLERPLPYRDGCPSITLNGGDMEIMVRRGFTDPGFTAVDGLGQDLSSLVSCEGEVLPDVPGDYELCYTLTNARGEQITALRRVTVTPLQNPSVIDPDGKLIYLTFDDGPGPYTDALLDVLAQYRVPATFFVTCRYPDWFDCIGRAWREGHSIGVHSASHNYYSIYSGEDAFFEDFAAVEALIREQTGSDTTLCRFPGGSSNTVSRFNRGIMSRLTQAVEERGYHYFDWNVSSGDAGQTTSTAQVCANIINGCASQRVSVVLQHDIKDYSVNAVEDVIVWALQNGYAFAALDENAPTAHHPVAN